MYRSHKMLITELMVDAESMLLCTSQESQFVYNNNCSNVRRRGRFVRSRLIWSNAGVRAQSLNLPVMSCRGFRIHKKIKIWTPEKYCPKMCKIINRFYKLCRNKYRFSIQFLLNQKHFYRHSVQFWLIFIQGRSPQFFVTLCEWHLLAGGARIPEHGINNVLGDLVEVVWP